MCMACNLAKPGRRGFLAAAALASAALVAPAARAADGPRTTLTPDQALAALQQGNARFRAGQVPPGAAEPARRVALAAGRRPSPPS